MKRVAFPCLVLLCCLMLVPGAFAQASKTASKKDATPAVSTPPSAPSPELLRARMRPPVRGTAYIEYIPGASKHVGNELVRVTKVKNVSDAPIVGLRIDDYYYKNQTEVASGSKMLRSPLAPGEVGEIETRALFVVGANGSQMKFTHAGATNGQVKPTSVKKFSDDKKDDKKK